MDKPLNDDANEHQHRASKSKFNKKSLNTKRATPSQASKLQNRLNKDNKEDGSTIRVDASQSQSPPVLKNQ